MCLISNSFIFVHFFCNAAAMDISADLQELTRCPVGLVSSGVKSILDIGRFMTFLHVLLIVCLSYLADRTLEYLVKPSLYQEKSCPGHSFTLD